MVGGFEPGFRHLTAEHAKIAEWQERGAHAGTPRTAEVKPSWLIRSPRPPFFEFFAFFAANSAGAFQIETRRRPAPSL